MEDQSLIPSHNKDNGEKQKKGCKPVLTVLFTTILLLGLVFYGGEYWGSHRARDGGSKGCDPPCDTPPGLDHPVCIKFQGATPDLDQYECQSGQPGAACDDTSDCVVPKGLDHAVCRDDKCQSGQAGASCGDTSDCVVPKGLDHAVCRKDKCQSGQAGARCGQTSDCLPIAGLNPPHAVCRKDKCQQ